MLRHGDIFRSRETDNLYMIDTMAKREDGINHYISIRIMDSKRVIAPETFFQDDCNYCGNLVKAQRKE